MKTLSERLEALMRTLGRLPEFLSGDDKRALMDATNLARRYEQAPAGELEVTYEICVDPHTVDDWERASDLNGQRIRLVAEGEGEGDGRG